MRHLKIIWNQDKICSTLSKTEESRERLNSLAHRLGWIFNEFNVQSIVDLGIGDGGLAKYYMSLKPNLQVVGLDFSHRLLAIAKNNIVNFVQNLMLIECDILEKLPLARHPDAFLLVRTLHHMDQTAIKELLNRLHVHCHSSTRIIIVERWAFIPRSDIQTNFHKIRLALSEAMFPGIGEFHHSFHDYKTLATETNYLVESLEWHTRQLSFEGFVRKVNKWFKPNLRQELYSCLRNGRGTVELPTMIMVLKEKSIANKVL